MSAELRYYTHSLEKLGWVKFPDKIPSRCVVVLSVIPHSHPPRYEAKLQSEKDPGQEQKETITLIFHNQAHHSVCFCTDGKHAYRLPVEPGQRRGVEFPRKWLGQFQFRSDPQSLQYSGFILKKL